MKLRRDKVRLLGSQWPNIRQGSEHSSSQHQQHRQNPSQSESEQVSGTLREPEIFLTMKVL